MGKAKQRRLDARANRQASLTARYGTAPIQVPPPKAFEDKEAIVAVAKKMPEVVEKRGPGRPAGTRISNTDKNRTMVSSSVQMKIRAGSATKGKKHGR